MLCVFVIYIVTLTKIRILAVNKINVKQKMTSKLPFHFDNEINSPLPLNSSGTLCVVTDLVTEIHNLFTLNCHSVLVSGR